MAYANKMKPAKKRNGRVKERESWISKMELVVFHEKTLC